MKHEVIIRRDSLGRVTLSKENIENLLTLYDKSHEPAQTFARRHGIKYPTFAHWLQQRRRKRNIKKDFPSNKTIPATFAVSEVSFPVKEDIVIEIAQGIRIYFSSQKHMGLVLELIERLGKEMRC